jgi:ribonucleoside-diphosphate reductase beta chain
MSTEQYNFKKQLNYLKRNMFLDPAGPVTVQRFEDFRYPKIAKYEETARGYFWVPEEISLTKDKMDHKDASDAIKHIFTSNLLRQTALDSLQGRSPTQIFLPVVSVPEMETLCLLWGFFESNIHSKSYSHIIRNIYNVPKDEFNKIHDISEIVQMASTVGNYYEALHILNCKRALGEQVPTLEHKKAIWLALHASYALEALRFMVSFATSLAMVENRIYIGNGNIISLILQDEILHAEWTAYIINTLVKDDPDFASISQECADQVYSIYQDVINEEKNWANYLFKKGVVIGLNEAILQDFMDWMAYTKLKEIGIKYREEHPKTSPIPWFNKHLNIHKKQAALQETESTSYIIGVMGDYLDHEQLPDL